MARTDARFNSRFAREEVILKVLEKELEAFKTHPMLYRYCEAVCIVGALKRAGFRIVRSKSEAQR